MHELDALYAARLRETLPCVRDAIAEAAAAAGRGADDVRLVAVTKSHPLACLRAALDAGLHDLGENRVEELEEKVAALGRGRVRWHMIGHVQSRKAARLVGLADLVHSVDSLKLATRLDRACAEAEAGPQELAVLVQVNTSGEGAKSGFSHDEAVEAVLAVAELAHLDVRGLMTMAPFVEDEAVLRMTFARLREVLEAARRARPALGSELSMGMTNDLRYAIEEGSTMVRIGTALFGERPGYTTEER